jgi:hypothetical protein
MARPRTNQTKAENIKEKLDNARQAELIKIINTDNDMTEQEKKEIFKSYWARSRKLFNKEKEIEEILWAHLKAIGCDSEDSFEEGIANFGLKKK